MTARLRVFRDAQDLAETLADETAALLNTAIAARGRASMALPGGRTPTPFLTALGRRDVDWSRVTVTLVEAAPVAGALRFELLSEGRVATGAQRRPPSRPSRNTKHQRSPKKHYGKRSR